MKKADWLSTTMTNDTLLTVYYDNNLSVDERSDTITISGEGVTSIFSALDQEGNTPEGSIPIIPIRILILTRLSNRPFL